MPYYPSTHDRSYVFDFSSNVSAASARKRQSSSFLGWVFSIDFTAGLGGELQSPFREFDGSRWIAELGRGAIGQEPCEGVGRRCRTGTGNLRDGCFK